MIRYDEEGYPIELITDGQWVAAKGLGRSLWVVTILLECGTFLALVASVLPGGANVLTYALAAGLGLLTVVTGIMAATWSVIAEIRRQSLCA